MATVIAYSLAIGSVLLSVGILVAAIGRMGVRRLTGLNDADTSKRYFLLLLSQARHTMIVYDDGDKVQDSVYYDDKVLQAIDQKLREDSDFRMQCLFNCPVPQPLHERFEGQKRIDARTTGTGDKGPRDTHLKIIDDGRMAYLTRHEFGSPTRPYELVDCLTVATWALRSVATRELGDCMEVFAQRFAQAAATD